MKPLVQRLTKVWLLLGGGLLCAGTMFGGPILQYQVTGIGSSSDGKPMYEYTYLLSGTSLLTNEELEIDFDPALYGALSNASGPVGVNILLIQPSNPLGTTGVLSALALVNNPSLTTPFRVDVVYLGTGVPGMQSYYLNQFNSSGSAFSILGYGTTQAAGGQVPEPATLAVTGIALGLLGCARVGRRFAAQRRAPRS